MPIAKPTAKSLPPTTLKVTMPKVVPPKPTPKAAPSLPRDPGPAPDMSDGKAFHKWCMLKKAWKDHNAKGENSGLAFQRWCMERASMKVADPKGRTATTIAVLKWVAENTHDADMKDRIENDLDALLAEDGLQSILSGQG